MRRVIRLTESDLHRIVAESVKQAINEIGDSPKGQYALGQAAGRRYVMANNEEPGSDEYWNNDTIGLDIERHAKRRKGYHSNTPFGWDDEFGRGFDDYVNSKK